MLTATATSNNGAFTLSWPSLIGRPFAVEGSSNAVSWTLVASNVVATEKTTAFVVANLRPAGFFRVLRYP